MHLADAPPAIPLLIMMYKNNLAHLPDGQHWHFWEVFMTFLEYPIHPRLTPIRKPGEEGSRCAAILDHDPIKSLVCETFEGIDPILIQD